MQTLAARTSLIAGLSVLAMVSAYPATIDWTQWNGATNGAPGSATGTNIEVGLSITYIGEVENLVSGYPSWGPTNTFSGGDVGNPPSSGNGVIQIFGGSPGVNTIMFSAPAVNPVMAIWSLGGQGIQSSFVFQTSNPITIESGGPSYEFGGSSILQASNTIYGIEVNGTIEFHGTFTEISWTNPTYENWYGFTVGVPQSFALQAQERGGNFILSWPLSSAHFALQATTNVANNNSWVTLTNVPTIVNSQNFVTNPITGGQSFYRLMRSP